MEHVNSLIRNLELKQMEGSLLAQAITSSVALLTDDVEEQRKVAHALALASYLHRSDTRANRGNLPRDTYITHPLRNTLRLIRYGCKDIQVLIASILHDTVEDHALDIVTDILSAPAPEGEEEARRFALEYYAEAFGDKVAFIVKQVSTPLNEPGLSKDEKRLRYAHHLDAALDDPGVFLVKISDFVDNAVGLYHNTGSPGMVSHLTKKYLQVTGFFLTRLSNPEFVLLLGVGETGAEDMRTHIRMGEKRLVSLQENIPAETGNNSKRR
jgi:hypothetical protein